MSLLVVFSSIGLPLMMAFGVIAAWRSSKGREKQELDNPAWRDDSLDDWRKQRDERADADRQDRETRPLTAGSAEERESSERQQRLGG